MFVDITVNDKYFDINLGDLPLYDPDEKMTRRTYFRSAIRGAHLEKDGRFVEIEFTNGESRQIKYEVVRTPAVNSNAELLTALLAMF